MGKIYTASVPFVLGLAAIASRFCDQKHLFILQSSFIDDDKGRYSFVGFAPKRVIRAEGKNAFDDVRADFHQTDNEVLTDLTPLPFGYVGFIGYEYGVRQEICFPPKDTDVLPDVWFGFYETIITIDHKTNMVHVTSIDSEQKVADIAAKLLDASPVLSQVSEYIYNFQLHSNFTKSQYIKTVEKARDYIEQGDIYQVNLSQKFSIPIGAAQYAPLDLYHRLTNNSPVPFGCFLDGEDFALVSNSPERFLRLKDKILQTRPMKGTAKRGANYEEDESNKSHLILSAKEQAELLMITDLLRNDLGRVCKFGTVQVKNRREIESYQTVYQTTSTIEGQIKDDVDCFDVLKVMLPGGSITGCPKVRAMEIIDELEPHRRGPYTGTLGYINPQGEMDFNILIRTLVVTEDSTDFCVGGGIVYDSAAAKEYDETLVKAEAIRRTMSEIFSTTVHLQ